VASTTDACASLLIAASRPRRADACPGFPSDQLAEFTDWTGLIALALALGLGGPLCERLLASAPGAVPDDIADAARAHIAFLRAAHEDGVAELLDLLDVLQDAGIEAVPFKGPVFAQQFYPDPALRRFTDLDVLISATDVEPAYAALVAHGYRSEEEDLRPRHLRAYWRYNGQDELHAPDRLPLEPHWLFGQRTLATHLDMPGFLSRARPILLGGRQVRALSLEDSLIAICFHGAKDEWQSLRTVADVAAILHHDPGPAGTELDWDTVRSRAEAGGVWRMVLIGLQLAATLLDVKLPTEVARPLAQDRVATGLADQSMARLFIANNQDRSIFDLSWYRWHMRERFTDRLRYAGATLFTARLRHFRTIDLPDWLCFLYPAVKIMQDHVAIPVKQRLSRRVVS
jgi:hypothetical protein